MSDADASMSLPSNSAPAEPDPGHRSAVLSIMLMCRLGRLLAVLGILFAVGLLAPPAHAQYADVLTCLRADADTPPTSSSFTISGDGFTPGPAQVTVAATQGTSEVTEVVDVAVDTSFSVTIELSGPDWDLTAPILFQATGPSGPDGTDVRTVPTTPLSSDDCAQVGGVAATPVPSAEPLEELTFTSSSTMPMVTIAVGAVALGGIVLFGLRRPGV